MKHDVIIVGGGLFGQIIARAFRAEGREVVVYDNREKEAGSVPAACLMKPSWFSGLGKEVYEPSLKLLDDLFGVKDIDFNLLPTRAQATVHWCDPADILNGPTVPATVTEIHPGRIVVGVTGGVTVEANLIIVAAGIWTEKLLPQYKQTAQKGVAFLWPKVKVPVPAIQIWAPYKQLVRFDRGDGAWVGDGTAIKNENWTKERFNKSAVRCSEFMKERVTEAVPLRGLRPYAKGHKPCLLEEVEKGLWVASGGAKNGTIAAGYCAHIIKERTS